MLKPSKQTHHRAEGGRGYDDDFTMTVYDVNRFSLKNRLTTGTGGKGEFYKQSISQ